MLLFSEFSRSFCFWNRSAAYVYSVLMNFTLKGRATKHFFKCKFMFIYIHTHTNIICMNTNKHNSNFCVLGNLENTPTQKSWRAEESLRAVERCEVKQCQTDRVSAKSAVFIRQFMEKEQCWSGGTVRSLPETLTLHVTQVMKHGKL